MGYLWAVATSSIPSILSLFSLLLLCVLAVVAVCRTRAYPASSAPSLFFAAAHVHILFSFLTNGVINLGYSFMTIGTMADALARIWLWGVHQILLSLAVHALAVLLLVMAVSLLTRQRPRLECAAALGVGICAANFALLLSLCMLIVAGALLR